MCMSSAFLEFNQIFIFYLSILFSNVTAGSALRPQPCNAFPRGEAEQMKGEVTQRTEAQLLCHTYKLPKEQQENLTQVPTIQQNLT